MYNVCMIRKNIYLDESQLEYLDTLSGTLAEHVRLAINLYITEKKREEVNVSSSLSKKGAYGRISTEQPSSAENQY